MRRSLLVVLAALLCFAGLPASVTARPAVSSHPWAGALDYDLEAVREVMTEAATAAKDLAPSQELMDYFAQQPLHWAHPQREFFTHEQPDGSTFAAEMLEVHEGGGQVVDGHLITRDEDGWWRYGIRQATGRVSATSAVVGRDAAPPATAADRMPMEFRENLARYSTMAEQYRQALQASNAALFEAAQAAGEPVVFKIPALMIEVNNEPFQPDSTPEKIESLYDGIGSNPTGTVTEMYLEQSFGNMVIEIDVYGTYASPLSVVVDSLGECWYGTDGGFLLGDQLGLGGYGSKGMALEAVPQADLEVDFSQYDNNGDGYVDFLMMVHSGPGAESTGDPCDVHSHYFNGLLPGLVEGAPSEPTPLSVDGVLIGAVLTVPELDANIGVVAHEIMHALGEPDYYGTAGTTGTGEWDLGAGGSWLGIPTQTNPIHFNPVMKTNFGWVHPQVITDTTENVTLRPRAAYPDLVMVPTRIAPAGSEEAALCDIDPINVGAPQNTNFHTPDGGCYVEGFLLENLSAVAGVGDEETCTFTPMDFDRQAYGSGLMVWHFDFTNYVGLGNNNVLRPMLDIEEADRRDDVQELETDVTRGDPTDLFWGDPIGISSATTVLPPSAVTFPPPAGSPYTVTAAPATTAPPTPEWTVPADLPDGSSMIVTLDWATSAIDDWDLTVEELTGGGWVEAGAAGNLPASGPEVVTLTVDGGETFRAVASNFLSLSPTAEVSVEFTAGIGPHKFGPANTWDASPASTGWQFTNIRPSEYSGQLGNATMRPGTPIVLDVIKHDESTVDVSGEFPRLVDPAQPLVSGALTEFETVIYEHGGAPVTATLKVYDGDPADGGELVASFEEALEGYERRVLTFEHRPRAGHNELWVTTSAPGDLVPDNDTVHATFEAWGPRADVLVVDNDRNWTQEEGLAGMLESLGVDFHVIKGEPTASLMDNYDATIWLTTTVSGPAGVLSPEGYAAIDEYLSGGGHLWLASSRAVGYLDAQGAADILARWFGLAAENNILDGWGEVTGQGGPIGGTRTIATNYIDGRPYLDYATLADSGVAGQATSLFEFVGNEGFSVGSMVETDNSTSVWTFPIGMVADGAEQQMLVREVLEVFGVPMGAEPTRDHIRMRRFQHVQPQQDWPVTIGATSPDGIESVTLHHRTYGDGTWDEVELVEAVDGIWTGTIPGETIFNNGIEYWAEAVTGSGEVLKTADESLPDVASAPYGDPMPDADYCAAVESVRGVDDDQPIPATGGGLAVIGLVLMGAAGLRARRQRTA